MTELMIDIETLSTKNNAVVTSIGAVAFEFGKISKPEEMQQFYMNLDINEQIDKGRHVCGDTIKWWMGQSDAARKAMFRNPVPVDIVLEEFDKFCSKNNVEQMWGNGATFDNVIVRNLYETHFLIEYPVKYNADMDYRTLRFLYQEVHGKDVDIADYGEGHNALDDAIYQTMKAQAYYKGIVSE